jgi:hypothetical protein
LGQYRGVPHAPLARVFYRANGAFFSARRTVMPISFQCGCGRTIRTAEENAGRSASCPACGVQLLVPATDGPRPVRDPAPSAPEEEPAAPRSYGYNLQSEEVVPVSPRPRAPVPGRRSDGDDDRRRPAPRRYDDADRFIKRTPTPSRGWTDGGVLVGLGMMVGGVVVTVGGLALGWIIFPGPILFVAGIICLIKGISSGKM